MGLGYGAFCLHPFSLKMKKAKTSIKDHPKIQKSQTILAYLMIFRRARKVDKRKINPRILELQAAKEILAEIFHARPEDIEEMIQSRLEERSWAMGQMFESDGSWPEAFCLGE